jgi:hypothetical protein
MSALSLIRWWMLAEAAAFVVASVVHTGVLVTGYEHRQARIAEAVIAVVLLGGAVVGWLNVSWTRRAALIAQGFALIGAMVGVFTIAVGVGPRTAPDVIYHVAIIVALVWGIVLARRLR